MFPRPAHKFEGSHAKESEKVFLRVDAWNRSGEEQIVAVHYLNQFVDAVLKVSKIGITHIFKFRETKSQSLSLQEKTRPIAATYKWASHTSE